VGAKIRIPKTIKSKPNSNCPVARFFSSILSLISVVIVFKSYNFRKFVAVKNIYMPIYSRTYESLFGTVSLHQIQVESN
jgi:hypothetical protein